MPEALDAFERAYRVHVLSEGPDVDGGLFSMNSRQAEAGENGQVNPGVGQRAMSKLCSRIVDEQMAQTMVYIYDGRKGTVENTCVPPDRYQYVTSADIQKFPVQPCLQLSGRLMKIDADADSGRALIYIYGKMRKNGVGIKSVRRSHC